MRIDQGQLIISDHQGIFRWGHRYWTSFGKLAVTTPIQAHYSTKFVRKCSIFLPCVIDLYLIDKTTILFYIHCHEQRRNLERSQRITEQWRAAFNQGQLLVLYVTLWTHTKTASFVLKEINETTTILTDKRTVIKLIVRELLNRSQRHKTNRWMIPID